MDDIVFDGIGDKAISAGEASNLRSNSIVIKSAEIGVTSKDASIVEISNISIDNTNIGFTVFTKKNEYGSAKILAKKILLNNVEIPYLIENSSGMELDGRVIPTVEFAVEDVLYGNLYGASSK